MCAELLEMRGVSIRFGAVQALDNVDLTVRAGEVHTIMGENGAGKSTLLKVLTGVYNADAGTTRVDGEVIEPRSPAEAQRLGVSMVYQEVNLVPHLSVAENICFGRRLGLPGLVSYRRMRARARLALERLGVDVDVDKPVSAYSLAVQQMVAIARALDVEARVLVLDEPTSSLDPGEVERLFAVMRRLREQGMALIFVSHFLDQVYEITDRLTVLRNGRLIGDWDIDQISREELVGHMLGREYSAPGPGGEAAPVEQPVEAGDVTVEAHRGEAVLEAREAGRKGSVDGLNFALRAGETTGLAGLLGSGRTEVGRLIFGADRTTAGEWWHRGRRVRLNSPRAAMALGFGFCSEDRKTEGIIPDLSVKENIVLALQSRRGWWRPVSRRKQNELAEEYIRALRIATPDAEKAVRYLSGGNQQKVILARWLAARPELLVLDEPTRGIDVGAKAEIEVLVGKLRGEGMAVVFISSELDETLRVSQQLIVMRDRRQREVLHGADINGGRVMKAMAGEGA